VSGLLTLVAVIVLVDTVFFAVLSPLLPDYAAALGLTKTAVGVLAGAFAAGVLVAALPSGLLASRVGIRPTLLLGLGLTAFSSVAFGLGSRFGLLVLTRFAAGVGSACSWTAAVGWLARTAAPERRGELIGFAISAAVAGAFLGPALGAVAAWIGTGPAFAAVAAACVGLAAWVVASREPSAEPGRVTLTAALGIRTLWVPLGLILLAPLLFAVLGVLVPLALGAHGWNAGWLGALYAAAAALEAVVHPLLGRWADRQGALAPISAGLIGAITVLLGLALAGEPWIVAGLAVAAEWPCSHEQQTRRASTASSRSRWRISRGRWAMPWALRRAGGSPIGRATRPPTWASRRCASECSWLFAAGGPPSPACRDTGTRPLDTHRRALLG
jgi:predicted MFS family arabinose efflux permease